MDTLGHFFGYVLKNNLKNLIALTSRKDGDLISVFSFYINYLRKCLTKKGIGLLPMPISANATITVRTVAETIAIALTFIIGNRCCERTIVAHGK